MNEKIEQLKNGGFLKALKAGLSSKYFPFVSAAVTLLCYYLGWDIVLIYYIAISGILVLTLLDDITPIISVFLFMSILISYKNSPSNIMGNSDYYFKTANLALIFTAFALFVSAAIYRIILTIIRKKFKLNSAFFGMCAFAAVLLLNGMFSEGYISKNLLYGLIMAASFLGIFSALKDNLKLDSEGYEKIAFSFFAFSIVLIIELAVKYITTEDIFVDGQFLRTNLTFGWGIWNTMGMWLSMCIPAVFYLAVKKNYGFVFTLYSVFLLIATMLSGSRQAMLISGIIYVLCIFYLFKSGKYRIPNLCIIGAVILAGAIILIVKHEVIFDYLKEFFNDFISNGELNGNGRAKLWRRGIKNYRSAPLLGVGFYSGFYNLIGFDGFSGLGFVPDMCHNTIIQILSSCGTLGLIAYLVHRVQSVVHYCKNITMESTFVALTILSLILVSLVDNHLFNIFPTIIYSSLAAALFGSVKQKTK